MKKLLAVTAIIEGLTGLALATAPTVLIPALLNTSLNDPKLILISRLGGGALIILAIACWLSRNNTRSFTMVKVITAYNIVALILLVYVALAKSIYSPGIWVAAILHMVLLIWCIRSARTRS